MSDTALLVIDLQVVMFKETVEEGAPIHNAPQVLSNTLQLLTWARKHNHRIAFIQHNESEGAYKPNNPLWEIEPQLGRLAESEPVFQKWEGDSFSNPELVEWIKGVKRVVLVGAQTDYCVNSTTEGAVKIGIRDVVVVKDAHSTRDNPREGATAVELIEKFNAKWAGLEGVSLVESAFLIR
ncbi:Isochorismatase hydrolase [Rhizoclosmatium globosum]|uniref:Isochorismatase hydrolase n=1 Tax=Rhizoclosmatium globosum TaxID=329046 RepID=A0A1Y2CTV7_9FUNG|nr:Isochorismatase hydrolase [Rhizoclosmatium globosum]|eukprot:ORY50469.1 Isochorismatase hydrolase [Rhizoclosmatium globosum]